MFRNTGKIYFPSQKVELSVYIPRGPPLNRRSRSTQELAVAQVTDWSRSTYQKATALRSLIPEIPLASWAGGCFPSTCTSSPPTVQMLQNPRISQDTHDVLRRPHTEKLWPHGHRVNPLFEPGTPHRRRRMVQDYRGGLQRYYVL